MKKDNSKTLNLYVAETIVTTVYANAGNKRKAKLEKLGIQPDKATRSTPLKEHKHLF